MECVYCAVRTGYLCVLCGYQNKQRLFPYTTLTGLYNRDGVCLLRGTDWIFMCFVWIWEQTAIISLHNINWLVCITEMECVYCAVRAGSLNVIQVNLSFWARSQNCKKWLEASPRLSVRTQLVCHWTNFREIWYLDIYRKYVEKFKFH